MSTEGSAATSAPSNLEGRGRVLEDSTHAWSDGLVKGFSPCVQEQDGSVRGTRRSRASAFVQHNGLSSFETRRFNARPQHLEQQWMQHHRRLMRIEAAEFRWNGVQPCRLSNLSGCHGAPEVSEAWNGRNVPRVGRVRACKGSAGLRCKFVERGRAASL